MKQIHFFAIKDDLLPILEAVERDNPIKYVRMGNSQTSTCETFGSGAEISNLGSADTDSASSNQEFLVIGRDMPVNLRLINAPGGDRYLVDQLINPDTVTFA